MMSAHYEDNAPSLLKHKLIEYTKPHLCQHNGKHSSHSLQHHHHPITTAVATKFCSNASPCTVSLFRFVYTTVCCMIQLTSGACLYYHMLCSLCDDSSQFPPIIYKLQQIPVGGSSCQNNSLDFNCGNSTSTLCDCLTCGSCLQQCCC